MEMTTQQFDELLEEINLNIMGGHIGYLTLRVCLSRQGIRVEK